MFEFVIFGLVIGCTSDASNSKKDGTTKEDTSIKKDATGLHDWSFGSIEIESTKWTLYSYIFDEDLVFTNTTQLLILSPQLEFTITETNDEEQYALGNTIDDFMGDYWIKFWWTVQNDNVYICLSEASTDKSVAQAATADPNNLTSGCDGNDIWWELREPLEISGLLQNEQYDWYTVGVNAFEWVAYYDDEYSNDSFVVSEIDRENRYLIGMNSDLDYRRVQWTAGDDGYWYICDPNAVDTLDEAQNFPVSDPSDLEDGCYHADGSSGRWRKFTLSY